MAFSSRAVLIQFVQFIQSNEIVPLAEIPSLTTIYVMDAVVAKVHMAIDHAFSASTAAASAASASAAAPAAAPPGVSCKNDGESHPGDVAQVRGDDI